MVHYESLRPSRYCRTGFWQVLLRWNVQRGVAVIPRSNTPANIQGNAKGLFEWHLTEAQKARPDRAL